jgi:hypothetical protein
MRAPEGEPPTREELVEARERIIAQLDEMDFRANAAGFARRGGGPPDYGGLIVELQEELREIDEILNIKD